MFYELGEGKGATLQIDLAEGDLACGLDDPDVEFGSFWQVGSSRGSLLRRCAVWDIGELVADDGVFDEGDLFGDRSLL